MNKFILIFIAAVCFTACAEVDSVPLTSKYRATDYIEYAKSGTGVVTGQAFMRQRGGAVVTCAGEVVMLVPNAGVFAEMNKIYESGKKPVKSKEYLNPAFYKNTKCDAQGNFEFNNVPAGQWIIQTEVRWDAGNFPMGGYLSDKIYLYDGEKVNRVLSK